MYLNWYSGAVILCLTHRALKICLALHFTICLIITIFNKNSFQSVVRWWLVNSKAMKILSWGYWTAVWIAFRISSVKDAWLQKMKRANNDPHITPWLESNAFSHWYRQHEWISQALIPTNLHSGHSCLLGIILILSEVTLLQ